MANDSFIHRDEYNTALQFLTATMDDLKRDFEEFKKGDFAEMRRVVNDLHKTLVESNGGRSIIDRLSYNEEKVRDLDVKVSSIIDTQNKRYKSFYDRFWVYFIRFIILLLALIVGIQFVGDSKALLNIVTKLVGGI